MPKLRVATEEEILEHLGISREEFDSMGSRKRYRIACKAAHELHAKWRAAAEKAPASHPQEEV